MTKKYLRNLLILVGIEIISFILYRPENLEFFFFAWTAIHFIILIYRWPGYGFNMFGIGTSDTDRYQNLEMSSENNPTVSRGSLFSRINVFDKVLVLLFLTNLIISLVVY